MKKTPIHQPKVEKVTKLEKLCFKWAEPFLTGLLIVAGIHILIFYVWSMFHPDMIEPVSAKYAVYIAIGSFFYLVVYNKNIHDRWDAKDVPPYKSGKK